jgi:citronellol/citronellal dehydrogenase
MCVLGLAAEFAEDGIAVNALWPRTAIDTAALAMLGGAVKPENTRKPAILADAAYLIVTSPSRETTGNFFIDDTFLASRGITDLAPYAVAPGAALVPDFFID